LRASLVAAGSHGTDNAARFGAGVLTDPFDFSVQASAGGQTLTQPIFGAFRLDRANRRLVSGGALVALRPKAFAVYSMIARNLSLPVTGDRR